MQDGDQLCIKFSVATVRPTERHIDTERQTDGEVKRHTYGTCRQKDRRIHPQTEKKKAT